MRSFFFASVSCLTVLGLSACGGDSFTTVPGGAAASAGTATGAGGSGTAGTGTAGSGIGGTAAAGSGAAGKGGSGKGGSGTAGKGGTGTAGTGGAGKGGTGAGGAGKGGTGTAGSGTAGGTAGSGTGGTGIAGSGTAGSGTAGSGTAGSGTAGSGTAGSGTAGSGTAGSGTAGSSTAGAGGGSTCGCPAPPDPCSIAVCNGGVCGVGPNPDPVMLPQMPHDCSVNQCGSGVTKNLADGTDTPPPLGPCDQVGCTGKTPTHTDDNAKCAVTETCSQGNCQCVDCPDGTISGLPSGTCQLPGGSTATAMAGAMSAGKAVDGSASTKWSSGLYVPTGATAEITATPGQSIKARAISINVDAANPLDSSAGVDITLGVVEPTTGATTYLPTVSKSIPNGGDMVVINLPMPMMVSEIQITLSSKQTNLAIYEIGYRTCP